MFKKVAVIIKYTTEDKVSNFAIFIDYYFYSLRDIIFSSLIYFILYYFVFNDPFIIIFFSVITIWLFTIMRILEIKYFANIKYKMKMLNVIFLKCLYENTDYRQYRFYLAKFKSYLKKFLDSIDRLLEVGVKIEDFEREKSLSIKKVITDYLIIYIKYGKQDELNSLRSNLSCISTLIEGENQRKTLDLIKPISKIYSDIGSFLEKRKYKVDLHKFSWFHRYRSGILLMSITLFAFLLVKFHDQFNSYLDEYHLSNVDSIQKSVALITAVFTLGTIIIQTYKELIKR